MMDLWWNAAVDQQVGRRRRICWEGLSQKWGRGIVERAGVVRWGEVRAGD
jgi:hypothetical protein